MNFGTANRVLNDSALCSSVPATFQIPSGDCQWYAVQFTTWPAAQSQALKTSETCAVCYFGVSLLSGWYVLWKASNQCTMPIVSWTHQTTFSAAVAFAVRSALTTAGLYHKGVKTVWLRKSTAEWHKKTEVRTFNEVWNPVRDFQKEEVDGEKEKH